MSNKCYITALILLIFSSVLLAQQPSIVLQQGHKEAIEEIVFNAKGSIMATGSNDGHINLIDPYTGLIIHTFKGHTKGVFRIIFSNKHLISASTKEIIVWDLNTEKEVFRTKSGLQHKENLAVSADGKLLAFSERTYKPTILFIDNEGHEIGEEMLKIKMEDRLSVRSLEFTKGGKNLLIGSSSAAYLWNIETQSVDKKMPTQQLPRLNYIDNSNFQYYAANDYLNWQVWDLNKGKYVNNFEGKKGDDGELNRNDFAIFNSNHTILGVTENNFFKLYDLKNGAYLRKCEALKRVPREGRFRKGIITAAAFNPRGELLVVATQFTYYDKDEPFILLRYFDVSSGREIRMTDGYSANVNLVKFSPDDKKLAITGINPTKIWSLGKAENCLEPLSEATNKPLSVFWSPDSKVLLTHGDWRTKTTLTDLTTKDEKLFDKHFYYRYKVHTGKDFLVSPDFTVMMGTNRAHHYFTGEIFCEFDLKKDYFRKKVGEPSLRNHPMVITPDNKTLVILTYQSGLNLTFIDLNNCEKSGIMNIPTKTKNGSNFIRDNYKIRISQSGKYLATIGAFVEIIDLEKKEIILSIEGSAIRRKLPYNDASFSFDDNYIALAGRNGDITVWDIAQKKEIQTLKGHQDQVTSVSFMHKKNVLASGGMDDRVMLWNAETGKEIATMVNIDDDDYIVVTPDNYYFSSKKALENAAFRLKNQVLPFEQFDLKYNRPDKVIKRIGTASIIKIKMYKKAYEKRLRKSGFTEEMLGDEFNLPELKVVDKYNLVTTTSETTFKFNVKGHDNLYPLDRLLVYINNVPVDGPNGVKIATGQPKKIEQEIQVQLSQGINKIQVSVINVKGVESIRDAFEVALDKEATKPDLYVLAVGISEYTNEERNLTYAAKDAQDIVNSLNKSKQYNKVHVKLILNKEATKSNILKKAAFLKDSRIDDQVMVYISSHGLLDDQLDYYLATTDVNFNNPSEKGLPYDQIEQLLEKVKSRNRLVLIDACHSGEIDKEEMILANGNSNQNVKATSKSGTKIVVPKTGLKNSFSYMQTLFSDVSKGLGATIISAAGGMEFAYETNDKKNGIFTYSIIEGLESKNADLNKDGEVQLTELQSYIQYRVHQLSGGLQVPTVRKINSYNDFVIY